MPILAYPGSSSRHVTSLLIHPAVAEDTIPGFAGNSLLKRSLERMSKSPCRQSVDGGSALNPIVQLGTRPGVPDIGRDRGQAPRQRGELWPYCGLIEMCVLTNFEGTGTDGMTAVEGGPSSSSSSSSCRPPKCPFANEAACAYVECCLDPHVQDKYGVALGLIEEGGEGVGPGLERCRQEWGRRWDFFGGERCDEGRRLGHPREMTKGEEYK